MVSDAITLSGVTIPAARRLAAFHPAITGGTVSLADDSWATSPCRPGARRRATPAPVALDTPGRSQRRQCLGTVAPRFVPQQPAAPPVFVFSVRAPPQRARSRRRWR